jgi:tetratricopeptide (TPR) repeat protein
MVDTVSITNWDEDVQIDAAETYQTLARSLARSEGFGIFLVRCVEGERDRLIQRLQKDLTEQQMAQLKLEAALEDGNLYNRVAAMLQAKPNLNVLFINGLEKSFEAYIKPGYGGQGDYYKMDSVPRVLGHLNLQRERFRNDFPVSLVFFLSPFGLKYMARRAPDFFDWRSGIYEFVADASVVRSLSRQISGDYNEYLQWTHEQRLDRIQQIQALLEEDHQTNDQLASLAFEQGNILAADQNYEAAIASNTQALNNRPDMYEAYSNRGTSLGILGRHKEAIKSYQKALSINPNLHKVWYNIGSSLDHLGFYEEAIEAYGKALEIQPTMSEGWLNYGVSLAHLDRYDDAIRAYERLLKANSDDYEAWSNRGSSLGNLGRYEEAILSYDKALEINPEFYEAWSNRGSSLGNLGRYEEAISSYDKALEINPEFYEAWSNRGSSLGNLGRYEEAISSYDKALEINPGFCEAWFERGVILSTLHRYADAINSYDQALIVNPNVHEAWSNRGVCLANIGSYKAAIESHNQALRFSPDDPNIFYNLACAYCLDNNLEATLQNLANAIRLNPEYYRNLANEELDFKKIRQDLRFTTLLRGELSGFSMV